MEKGNTVQLKSGGPIMTIQSVNQEKAICKCQWFDNEDNLQDGLFPLASLKEFVYPTIED